MNKKEYELLSPSEITCLIVGLMVGMGALILPNDVMATSRQDGWMSAALGAVYPLVIMLLSVYIINNFQNTSILDISRKLYGRIFGNILNVLFAVQFIFYSASVAQGFSNLLRLYMVSFLTPLNVLIFVFLIVAYTSGKGLKTLARVNEMMFFLTIFILVFTINALKDGSFLNVSPVFGSGINNIIAGGKDTMFAYATSEALLLVPGFIRDKNKLKNSVLKAIGVTALIYTWMTFITIYYLGPDIVDKNLWAFTSVTDSVKIPLVTNFRFVFTYLWSLIIFKTISNEYYFAGLIISNVTKVDFKIINVMLYPIMIFLAMKLGNETMRRKIGSLVVPWITLYSILFVLSIAVIIYAKKVISNGKTGDK